MALPTRSRPALSTESPPPPPRPVPPPNPPAGSSAAPRAARRLCCSSLTLSWVEAKRPQPGDEQGEGAQHSRQPLRPPHGSLRARSAPGPPPQRPRTAWAAPAPLGSPMPPASPLAAAAALPSRGGKPPRTRSPSPPGPSHPLPAPLRRRGGRGRPFLLPSLPPPPSPLPQPPAGRRGGCQAAFRRWPSLDPHFKAGPGPGPPPGQAMPNGGARRLLRPQRPPAPGAPRLGGPLGRWPPGTPRPLVEAAESPRTVSLAGEKRTPETSSVQIGTVPSPSALPAGTLLTSGQLYREARRRGPGEGDLHTKQGLTP